MNRWLMVVGLVVLGLAGAPVAHAEMAFTHHVPFMNVTTHGGAPKVLDLGYDFTTLRLGRFHLLGAGAGLDQYAVDGLYRAPKVYFVGHVASFALARDHDKGDGWLSVGTRYIYHPSLNEHRLAIGFSGSFRIR